MYTCKCKLLTWAWAQGPGPWGGCRAGPGSAGPGTLGPALAAPTEAVGLGRALWIISKPFPNRFQTVFKQFPNSF